MPIVRTRAHTAYERVTPEFAPKDVGQAETDDLQEQDAGDIDDWWSKAVSDMVNGVFEDKPTGVYHMGLAASNHGGDYDEFLEKASTAAGDVGMDDGEVDRQFRHGYECGEKDRSQPSRGRPSTRQIVRNAVSGEGIAECLKVIGYGAPGGTPGR